MTDLPTWLLCAYLAAFILTVASRSTKSRQDSVKAALTRCGMNPSVHAPFRALLATMFVSPLALLIDAMLTEVHVPSSPVWVLVGAYSMAIYVHHLAPTAATEQRVQKFLVYLAGWATGALLGLIVLSLLRLP